MPLGTFSKDKLVFDPTAPAAENDNVGAFVRAGTDGDAISSTNVGGKEGLDVNIINTVTISDPANHAEDSGHVSGDIGKFVLGVRNDTNAVLTSADLDYSPLAVDSFGRLKVVADLTVTSDFVYAEDDANVSGSLGAYVLSVRQDTLATSTSASGDYADFKVNDRGALWTVPVGTVADDAVDTENPVKIGSHVQGGPLTAVSAAGDRANAISDLYRRIYVNNGSNIAINNQSVPIDNTVEVALPTTALSGRRTVMIQNTSNREIYIGKTGVTSANGWIVGAKSGASLDLGPDVVLFAIGSTVASQDIRVFEMA